MRDMLQTIEEHEILQHMDSHMSKRKCEYCEKSFTRLGYLRLHKKRVHGILSKKKEQPTFFTCDSCSKSFSSNSNLKRHNAIIHAQVRERQYNRTMFSCRHCDCHFHDYEELFCHVSELHPLNQEGGRKATTPPSIKVNEHLPTGNEKALENGSGNDNVHGEKEQQHTGNRNNSHVTNDETALRNGVVNRNIYPRRDEKYDALIFFANIRDQIRAFLASRAHTSGGIKWNLCVQVEMQREDGEDIKVATPYFRSRTYITLSQDDWNEHQLNEAMQKMFANLEKFLREGSGWYVHKVLKLEIHTVGYKPLHGSSYMALPKTLSKSNCILNIQNEDNKCFLYCILAYLHPAAVEPESVEQYLEYEKEIDISGIVYPVTLAQIGKFEKQNRNISINVFTFEDDSILPLRITEQRDCRHHVNLLWLSSESTCHYYLITNLNRFLSRTKTHSGQHFFCHFCLHGFCKEQSLEQHQQYCLKHEAQRVELPTVGKNDILEFKDFEKTLKVPFVIYADFETILRKLSTCARDPDCSATTPSAKLEVCGFGYKVVCQEDKYTKPSVIYRGEDAGEKLIECLLQEQEEILRVLSTIEPMEVTDDDVIEKALRCCICNKQFSFYDKVHSRIVRHHNHLTGEFIGAACNRCNLSCKQAKFIPVILHNSKNFDSHILCENIGIFKKHRLKCIAQNTEKYITFSLDNLRFIDSYQFLVASLETLVDDLAKDGLQAFPYLLSETDNEGEADLLLRKGVYPYEYMDSFEKFEESELPTREEFYSTLKKEHISSEDYEHACSVFQTFKMSSLGQYHDLYLKTDVVLLADVFESFRNLCLKQYQLDPCHFYTSPGLSWSACLKMTGVQLQLLTDIDKVLMVEAGIRGGVSQISNRYKKANNHYLEDYDPSQPTSFLQYLDANNLYGWAMVQPLPMSDFVFMTERDIALFDIMSIPEDGDIGYILEVSLHYPKSLHDMHNCLPLAPVRKAISAEELSPYAQYLLRKLHGLSENDPLPKQEKVAKLLTTLEDKDHYVSHYRNIQLYLRLGMEVKTIHRILKFKQGCWLKPYIEQNTESRKQASSLFQKNYYKLMNVSVFGKTMENVRRHKNIQLVHTERRLKKLAAKSTYKHSTIFNEDLVAIELFKAKVNLFKPIYCGMCILDLSKYLMYDFWYNHIKQKYKDTAQLHMTDTDSILFSCETRDIYEDMKDSLDLFDTSDYPKEHFLHSDLNKKELGKMKDETKGMPISEFVGLRSKMYSFLCNGEEVKRAKGIAKVTVKKVLKHNCYKDTLFGETSKVCSMYSIRSHKHELFVENIQKIGLSAFCNKRYLMDAVESYGYGHYKTVEDTNSDTLADACDSQTLSIDSMQNISVEYCHCNSWEMVHGDTFVIDGFEITPCVHK